MATKRSPTIDFATLQEKLQSQFRGLNRNDPSSWPALPRYALCTAVTVLVLTVLWFVWLSGADDELQAERAKEIVLREDYKKKLAQAVNLEALKKQREQEIGRAHV